MLQPLLLVLLGLGIGALLGWLSAAARQSATREALAAAQARATELEHRAVELDSRLAESQARAAGLQADAAGLQAGRQADAERLAWTEKTDQRLREAFDALAAKALHSNSESFVRQTRDQLDGILKQMKGDWSTQKEQMTVLVQPVERSLKALDEQVRQLEQKREGAYRSIEQQLGDLKTAHRELRDVTGNLKTALTTSSRTRGQWGELQLRRIVEMTGMTSHVDFEEQHQAGDQRPDMIIRLPNGGVLPVDAKTPLENYLRAAEARDEAERLVHLRAQAAAMRSHVMTLGRKEYWKQFEHTPEVVVMFVPSEACLSASFDEDPGLMEDGLRQQVLLATPVTLYGLLKAVAYGWQQQTMAENAREIAAEGRELCDRLAKFLEHLGRTGRNLDAAVKSFNEAVGSAESRLLPSARRLRELGAGGAEPPPLEPIERQIRTPTAE